MTAPAEELPEGLVGGILGALAFGAALGVGLQALVTWTVRALQRGVPPAATPSLASPPALALLLGTLLAIVAAGLAAWRLLAPIKNPWRQAMLAIITGLGSFMLSLITLPVDRAWGPTGLLGLAGVCGFLCLLVGRRLAARGRPA